MTKIVNLRAKSYYFIRRMENIVSRRAKSYYFIRRMTKVVSKRAKCYYFVNTYATFASKTYDQNGLQRQIRKVHNLMPTATGMQKWPPPKLPPEAKSCYFIIRMTKVVIVKQNLVISLYVSQKL